MTNLQGLLFRMQYAIHPYEIGDARHTGLVKEGRKRECLMQLASKISEVVLFENPPVSNDPLRDNILVFRSEVYILSPKQMEDLIHSIRVGEFKDD